MAKSFFTLLPVGKVAKEQPASQNKPSSEITLNSSSQISRQVYNEKVDSERDAKHVKQNITLLFSLFTTDMQNYNYNKNESPFHPHI